MPYDKSTQKKYGENPLPQKSSGFKMKGSPMKRNFGIGADSPMKETTMPSYTGADIDPRLSYEYKGAKIPSFRDFVSLEQQQAYADKVDKRRAKKKQDKKDKQDKHFADKKLIEDAKKGEFTDQVETVDTKEAQENTVPNRNKEINIVTDGEVTGKTNTSSRPENTGNSYSPPTITPPTDEGDDLYWNEDLGGWDAINVDRSNSLY